MREKLRSYIIDNKLHCKDSHDMVAEGIKGLGLLIYELLAV